MYSSLAINSNGKIAPSDPTVGEFPCPASGMRTIGSDQCQSITSSAARNARACMPSQCQCPWRSCKVCIIKGVSKNPRVIDFVEGVCADHQADAGLVTSQHTRFEIPSVIKSPTVYSTVRKSGDALKARHPRKDQEALYIEIYDRYREQILTNFTKVASEGHALLLQILPMEDLSNLSISDRMQISESRVQTILSDTYTALDYFPGKVYNCVRRKVLRDLYKEYLERKAST